MPARVAVLTCNNTKTEFSCPSHGCLETVNKGLGSCERYKEKGGAELVGLIACAGCPTSLGGSKVLRQIKPLAMLGVEAIHLSSCMMSICPFKRKYAKAIKEAFPDIEVVENTHEVPPEIHEAFCGALHQCFTEDRTSMGTMIAQQIEQMKKMQEQEQEQ